MADSADGPPGGDPADGPSEDEVDTAFADIVSHLEHPLARDPGLRRPDPVTPRERAPDPDADEHYTPPAPQPLPKLDRIARAAWAGVIAGPVLVVVAALAGLTLPGWVLALAGLAFAGGFATLVARAKDRARQDDGWDDGAVV